MLEETKKVSLFRRVGGWIGIIFVLGLLVINGYLIQEVQDLSKQYAVLHEEVVESREANENVLVMLQEIRDEQRKQSKDLQKAMRITMDKRIEKNNVILLKQIGYDPSTDLAAYNSISVEDMNKIIDYYAEHACHSTTFVGHGEAFIQAAKETGLNPIYLFAHASCESDFGCSYIATSRHNYFGINAVDSNPDAAYAMGDSIDEGIMTGARWIRKYYYDQGYTTLDSMYQAGYCTDSTWVNQISSIANTVISVI